MCLCLCLCFCGGGKRVFGWVSYCVSERGPLTRPSSVLMCVWVYGCVYPYMCVYFCVCLCARACVCVDEWFRVSVTIKITEK